MSKNRHRTSLLIGDPKYMEILSGINIVHLAYKLLQDLMAILTLLEHPKILGKVASSFRQTLKQNHSIAGGYTAEVWLIVTSNDPSFDCCS